MFFDKKKYVINISAGRAVFNTEKMKGMVEHLIVSPYRDGTIWDLSIKDMDGDELFNVKNYTGRMDDRQRIPIGRSIAERLTLNFSNVSFNGLIDVIFIIQEV